MNVRISLVTLLLLLVTLDSVQASCTSIVVSRGASSDGSVMITYSADAAFLPKLLFHPGGVHEAGSLIDIVSWEDDRIRGQIPQVERTYRVVGLMNEMQVTLGETTTGGRRELINREGLLDYSALMWLTLQRAGSAREAIQWIDRLVHEYGYSSSGETISIADKNEAWIMEIIGKGSGRQGAVWVAARIPDGSITAHANMSRITTFPLDDPDNWLYSEDVIDFAIEQGFFDPRAGKPFSFRHAYHPNPSVVSRRVCATRVWSVYRRCAPSQTFEDAYHRGDSNAEDYPLFIQPENRLSSLDVMNLMRDHYEGTPYDMTQGLDAGPFASPYRFRGFTWKVDGQDYCWERPISTQQAGFVMTAQCRGWLPDPVGGVYWFAPDDAYTSCFLPLYCGISRLPENYVTGDYDTFSWDSAFWVFNVVADKAYDRWSRVFPDVEAERDDIEATFMALLPTIDETASSLFDKDPELAQAYLTQFSCGSGDEVVKRWRDLFAFLTVKHNDGYVRNDKGRARGVGYPEEWLRRVLEEHPEKYKVPRKDSIHD